MMENWDSENFSPLQFQSGPLNLGETEYRDQSDDSLNYVANNSVAMSRFPKLPEVEAQQMRLPPRSAPHVIGHSQSSFNITPRPHTPHQLLQTGRYEVLDENSDGRFPRSRSLNQHRLLHQQKYQGIDEEAYYTHNGLRHSDHNQRKYKSRPTLGNSHYVPSYAHPQSEQPCQFITLPMEIRQIIRHEAPGTIITDYFGLGITVSLLLNDNINDNNLCHVVFTANPETEQYWLKAFSKKTRSREGNIPKFNRLLTRNVNLEFCGKTAVLIGPPNNAPFHPNVEKHLFNFCEEREAFRFCEALERGRTAVWNYSELRSRNPTKFRLGLSQSQTFGKGFRTVTQIIPNANTRSTFCRPIPAIRATPAAQYDYDYYVEDQARIIPQREPWKINLQIKLPLIRFIAQRVELFVKIRMAYTLLGVGEISILRNPSGHEELIFRGPRKEIICDHRIYSWTTPKMFYQNSDWECTWPAAANLLITINANQMPTTRELKIVAEKAVILQFFGAFQASVSAALVNKMAAYDSGEMNPTIQLRPRSVSTSNGKPSGY